jgi:hypothetical protein
MMHVLDVRLNANIDRETLQKIMEQVMINSTGNSTEYEWMELIQSPVNVQHQQQQQSYAVMLASGVVETAATAANNMSNSMIPPAATTTSTSASGRRAAQQQQQQPVSENKQKPTSAKKRRTTNASFSIKPRVNSSGSQVSSIKRSKSTGSVTLNMSGASAGGGGGSSRAPGPSHRGANYHGHHHRHHPNSVKRHHTCHNAASASSTTALNVEQRWRSSAARLIARSRHNRIASPVDADFIDEDDQFVCFKSL